MCHRPRPFARRSAILRPAPIFGPSKPSPGTELWEGAGVPFPWAPPPAAGGSIRWPEGSLGRGRAAVAPNAPRALPRRRATQTERRKGVQSAGPVAFCGEERVAPVAPNSSALTREARTRRQMAARPRESKVRRLTLPHSCSVSGDWCGGRRLDRLRCDVVSRVHGDSRWHVVARVRGDPRWHVVARSTDGGRDGQVTRLLGTGLGDAVAAAGRDEHQAGGNEEALGDGRERIHLLWGEGLERRTELVPWSNG